MTRILAVETSRVISIKINQPLDVSITLWGPNGEDWTDESDLTLPAGGAEVTFRAQGFGEGDMVTFTVDGEAQDAVEADAVAMPDSLLP